MTEPIEIYKFETLYGKDIKGKIKTWQLRVERYENYSIIVTLYGYDRLIETRRQVNSGKNLNKSNMTIPYTQAITEAMSKWTKKRDIEGYKINVQDINTNENTNVNTKPMLANDYHKQKSKLKFPCYIEPKLDGMRLIYDSNNESVLSRQGKSFDILKESDLMKELRKLNKSKLVFDGELYLHGGIFEHLGILRKKKITNDELIKLNKIEYHIYDIIDENNGYSERYEKLRNIINGFTKIKLIKCIEINNEFDIKRYHSQFIEQGYEGSMLRNKEGGYKCKYRSNNLLKYKDWMDSEFKIVDYKFETDTSGDNDNLIMWVCKLENKDTVDIRPKGSHIERKNLYKECQENFDKYKGRNLWVKFFGYTEKGSLRFPSTKTDSVESYIRDVIE